MRKSILISAFFVFAAAVLSAHGKKDIEEHEVTDLNNWEETFDLSGKKGKYNIYIQATDIGGNTHVEGPHNLYVDPKSDLPTVMIINPYYDMRITENLNIVGSAADDDKVDHVDLILDRGLPTEQQVTAKGKEFWSYYLDTSKLPEGPHTIEAVATDINGLQGNKVSLRWQLDRQQPVTALKNLEMGTLVSGKVKFKGQISDGNGIAELYYSIDNGETFLPVKISKTKEFSVSTFDFTVDSRQYEDGPAVIWFKAVDNATSVGYYTFLYYIDNTKPDLQIVSPEKDEVQNGKIAISGFAKDKVGIESLTWTFGSEKGEIQLDPGNPYWFIDIDKTNQKAKKTKFTIKAVDKAGNAVSATKTILIDQAGDIPTVQISEPVPKRVFNDDEEIYVTGSAFDDDGIAKVRIQLDKNEPVEIETQGPFYYKICEGNQVAAGNHKITVTAIDVNGVESKPSVTEFGSFGGMPVFESVKVGAGKDAKDFVNGIEIHPETNSVLSMNIKSEAGIKTIRTELAWGTDQKIQNDVPLKKPVKSQAVTYAITPESPRGVLSYTVTATDIYDRVAEYRALFYVTNVGAVKADKASLVFDDSTISKDGVIILNQEFPVTGYVIGGKAVGVEISPSTPLVKAELDGNNVRLVPRGGTGISEKAVVRVKLDTGNVIESRPFTFKAGEEKLEITITGHEESKALNAKAGPLTIIGQTESDNPISSIKYRTFGAKAELKNGALGAITVDPAPERWNTASLSASGNFQIKLNAVNFAPGMYIMEILAETTGGKKATKALAFTTIPAFEGKGSPKAPEIKWLDGEDVYGVALYQGPLDKEYQVFPRSTMNEGANPLTMDVTATDTGKTASGKFTAQKKPTLSAVFATVNGKPYASGMNVVLASGKKEPGVLTMYIDTGAAVNSVTYEITGEEAIGGDVNQKGTAKLKKPESGNRWIAEIPLANLPSRMTTITATVKAGAFEEVVKGSLAIVRSDNDSLVDDSAKVYAYPGLGTTYNASNRSYVFSETGTFHFYANVGAPISAELQNVESGTFKMEVSGKLVTITPQTEGVFNGVVLSVKDVNGNTYNSQRLNFVADARPAELVILTPDPNSYVQDSFMLSGTVADAVGVKSLEYSLDNGATWTNLMRDGADRTDSRAITFRQRIDIKPYEEGFIGVTVRAVDASGMESIGRVSVLKDVTAPQVTVIEPKGEDVINGKTTIVFKVEDAGPIAKVEYVAPPRIGTHEELELKNGFVSVDVGTETRPLDEAMSFVFTDAAGNTTVMERWEFDIDNESDLPVVEIHVPDDMQVITRDFTISGVVYDDDGDCAIFYKIDDDEYKQVAESASSFSIDIPLSSMTDNEHTVYMYAADVYGTKGEVTERTFRISLEEPKATMLDPSIDTTVSGLITILGTASDKNGIEKVQISLDNGNTYNDAEGQENWIYTVDTRAIVSGSHAVFLRVWDKYGIQSLYSALLSVDNLAPEITLDLPMDNSATSGMLFFSGFAYDNIGITDLYVTIRNLETPTTPIIKRLKIDRIIGETVDMRDLPDGNYNIELSSKDKAGNMTNLSRNIVLDKTKAPAQVDLLYPFNGEYKQGVFNIYGQATSDEEITSLKLYIDGKAVEETELTPAGYFRFDMSPSNITEGAHTYRVDATLSSRKVIQSREQTITYSPIGPWVTVDNFDYGDFAFKRPYLRGQAGYSIAEEEMLLSKTKNATADQKKAVAEKKVAKIELSFDNGRTFRQVSTSEKWRYRIENQDIGAGYHFLLVRATMKNGEIAITRFIFQIDDQEPMIKLIGPVAGGRYNQELIASGISNDDTELESVKVVFRKGDKASYEIPGFIQGLYLDIHFWGATLFELGAGLTFFDDHVRIQGQWGQFTQAQRDMVSTLFGVDLTNERYGGNVFGVKLLANIAELPFSFFWGHDWEWLYAYFYLGAQFSWFDSTSSGKTQELSALVGQIEFPCIKIPEIKMFSTLAFYTEGSLWFIPTDVESQVEIKNVIPQFSFGIRANVF